MASKVFQVLEQVIPDLLIIAQNIANRQLEGSIKSCKQKKDTFLIKSQLSRENMALKLFELLEQDMTDFLIKLTQ